MKKQKYKFSKKVKLKAYKYALKQIQEDKYLVGYGNISGICEYLHSYLEKKGFINNPHYEISIVWFSGETIPDQFKEFEKYRSSSPDQYGYWWKLNKKGYKKRKKILKKCIKKLEKKLS